MADYQGVDMAQDTRICNWGDCLNPAHDEWPICFAHAYFVEREVSVMLQPEAAPADVKPPALVYYLMLGPNTVKIGTTTNLSRRLSQLRSDPQYVLAVEPAVTMSRRKGTASSTSTGSAGRKTSVFLRSLSNTSGSCEMARTRTSDRDPPIHPAR
ncbi:hypothetical protein GS931_17445 [Rhodococcus hoagii]|nr:hypothetical protein [Prescottella equi]